MRPFLGDDFLLDTRQSRALYHGHAAKLPIIDYHSHLPPRDIAQDRRWDNVAQIWLDGDHYKWRLMRAAGVEERFCTGGACDREKFDRYAAALPLALRNPLYHWTHMELRNYFGISDRLLSPSTADSIWRDTRRAVRADAFSARGLLRASRVEVVCTTDDPTDALEHHRAIAADASLRVRVLPTWRPDRSWMVADAAAFNAWVDKLGGARRLDAFLDALQSRHAAFHERGCRLSDYGVAFVPNVECGARKAATVFARVRAGRPAGADDALAFQSFMMRELAQMDAQRGWTMQIHAGPLRDANGRLRAALGADAGCDSIGDYPQAEGLARHLDRLDRAGRLPKTILYNSNPRDNELFASLCGNFSIQYGSAWWFMDQLDGMTRHLEALSQLGLLGRFVGMTTDSRSFLSFVRHEYFRRLLCALLGADMARGRIPDDERLVGTVVSDICYNNARSYFGFDDPAPTRR